MILKKLSALVLVLMFAHVGCWASETAQAEQKQLSDSARTFLAAAKNGNATRMAKLLKEGVSVNVQDKKGLTALHRVIGMRVDPSTYNEKLRRTCEMRYEIDTQSGIKPRWDYEAQSRVPVEFIEAQLCKLESTVGLLVDNGIDVEARAIWTDQGDDSYTVTAGSMFEYLFKGCWVDEYGRSVHDVDARENFLKRLDELSRQLKPKLKIIISDEDDEAVAAVESKESVL